MELKSKVLVAVTPKLYLIYSRKQQNQTVKGSAAAHLGSTAFIIILR